MNMDSIFNKFLKNKQILIISIFVIIGFVISPSYTLSESQSLVLADLELIYNGDFSKDTAGYYTTYVYSDGTLKYEGFYGVNSNPHQAYYLFEPCHDHTTGETNMMVVNGSPVLYDTVWNQVVDVRPDNIYLFSIWMTSVKSENPAKISIYINGELLNPNLIELSPNTCEWNNYQYVWESKDAEYASIVIYDMSIERVGNDFAIDDISFKPLCSVIANAGEDKLICKGESIEIGYNVKGGYTPYNIKWQPSEFLSSTDIVKPIVNNLTETTSFVMFVTDSLGCFSYDTVTVVIAPEPQPVIVSDKQSPICPCDSMTLTAIGGIKYLWDTGDTTATIVKQNPGVYGVTVFNEYGCSASTQFEFKKMDVSVDLYMDTINVRVGEAVVFPLKVKSEQNQVTCGYMNYFAKIRFNNTMLLPVGTFESIEVQGNDQIVTVKGTTVDNLLRNIEFITALGNDICSDIIFEEVTFDCNDMEINTSNGKICLTDICKNPVPRLFDASETLFLNNIYPNPTESSTTIKFGIIEQANSRLYVMNSLGAISEVIIDNLYKPGSYEIEYSTVKLSSGSYYIVLETPTSKLVKRMDVIK